MPADLIEESANGRSVDADGWIGSAVSCVIALNAVTTPDPTEFSLEESTNESLWTPVAGGTAGPFAAPFDDVVVINFFPTKRYLRCNCSAAEGSELHVSAVFVGLG